MKKPLRRPQVRRIAARAGAGIRRRPRTSIAAATLLILAAVALGGSLVLIRGQSPATPMAPTQPTFTYAGGWTLVELESHLAAGDVTAISAVTTPAAAGTAPDSLVARTRDGQVVTIDLAVTANEARSEEHTSELQSQ